MVDYVPEYVHVLLVFLMKQNGISHEAEQVEAPRTEDGEEPWLLPIFSPWCLHLLCFMRNTILLHEKYQEYMHILRYIVYQECYLIVC